MENKDQGLPSAGTAPLTEEQKLLAEPFMCAAVVRCGLENGHDGAHRPRNDLQHARYLTQAKVLNEAVVEALRQRDAIRALAVHAIERLRRYGHNASAIDFTAALNGDSAAACPLCPDCPPGCGCQHDPPLPADSRAEPRAAAPEEVDSKALEARAAAQGEEK